MLMQNPVEYPNNDRAVVRKAVVVTNHSLAFRPNDILLKKYVSDTHYDVRLESLGNWRELRIDILRDKNNGHLKVQMNSYWKVTDAESQRGGCIKSTVELDIIDDTITIYWTKPTPFIFKRDTVKESQEEQEEILGQLDDLEARDAELRK